MPFLRSLRSKTARPQHDEVKMLLADYFNSLWANGPGGMHDQTRPWPVERAVAEGFERVMWVFKAVNTIATDSARLPYRLREGVDGDEIEDHPMYRVLNKKANPLETGQVFRKRLSAQVLLSKRGAFVEVTRSNAGTIVRMDLLPPGRTVPVPGGGTDLLSHFRLTLRDGQQRDIPPENVRWFRDPHPIDPYSGVTPLESAGMSVELDYFSRLYNVMFMRNDGRPGGVLAVEAPAGPGAAGDMDPADMAALEAKFGKGPLDAGALAVINGKLTYQDLGSRPRDMQYQNTSRNSKIELLSAFGVAESVLGYAADRTFDNAEQELYNYWTRTMPGHNEIIVSGFDEDSEDNLFGFLDVSGVEVLERGERAKRSEAREEYNAGLRSIESYVTLAGYGDEIESTPYTRALYVPQGRTPVPANEDDAKALGLDQPAPDAGSGGGAPPPADPNAQPPGQPPADGQVSGAPPTPTPTPAAGTAVQDSIDRSITTPPRLSVVGGRKTRIHVERKAADETVSDPDERAAARLEDSVAAALTALVPRWTERVVARLEAPKARMGTRHWVPDGPKDRRVGNKALDAAKAVDGLRWAEEAVAQLRPLVGAAAEDAANVLFSDLGSTGQPDTPAVVATPVEQVLDVVFSSAEAMAQGLASDLAAIDTAGGSVDDMAAETRAYANRLTTWAQNLATQVATATTAAARDAAAETIAADGQHTITARWRSRRDNKVRPTHAAADGQTQPLGEPFIVGGETLRFPGDPQGSPGETRNCRCRVQHVSRRTGRFVTIPAAVS